MSAPSALGHGRRNCLRRFCAFGALLAADKNKVRKTYAVNKPFLSLLVVSGLIVLTGVFTDWRIASGYVFGAMISALLYWAHNDVLRSGS